jgi:hypothetical protein
VNRLRQHSFQSSQPHRIAIVGSGPRGLSVLERIAARILTEGIERPVEIHLIDPIQIGCGRIWRTNQPDWFVMNTVADEVSSFSGPPDDGPARPGAGPSLAQWWQSNDPHYPGENSYAPRTLHGRYMLFVLATIEAALGPLANLHKVKAWVTELKPEGGDYALALSTGTVLKVDRVILATGHSTPALDDMQEPLANYTAKHPDVRYIRGDSAADMPLAEIPAGSPVGIFGLGLSFYDVMAALTEGRGGRFVPGPTGELEYIASGEEPVLFAGSRSGLPIPARGKNQKHANYRYEPAIFTHARVNALRERGQVDFRTEVLPLLMAEVNLVYYETAIRHRFGTATAAEFRSKASAAGPLPVAAVVELAADCGIDEMQAIDLDRIAHPFAGQHFASPQAFESTLMAQLRADIAQAEEGNVDSPLKAALDVIRDTRALIRTVVDFGGLTPASHRTDFLNWYVPRSAFLSAGPPRARLQQVMALIRAGILRIVGPGIRVTGSEQRPCFIMSSPQVEASAVEVLTMIDARIPVPNLHSDPAPLTKMLVEQGIWTNFVNRSENDAFATGGVAVTPAPFHPINRHQQPDRQLYVLGIPSEHTRWFMQAGSSRPGFWTDFVINADAIATDVLLPARTLSMSQSPDRGRVLA